MNFGDRILGIIDNKKNPTVVGLDPRIEQIPNFIKEEATDKYGDTIEAVSRAFIKFNKEIIDAISDIVGIIKPQMAFYEKYGIEGIKAFCETAQYAKSKKLLVIEDAKRNDIGSTARAYSDGHIGRAKLCSGKDTPIIDVDAITVNPYLGFDGIKPFIDDSKKYDKGCFVLVKTSNPSSRDIQDKKLSDGRYVFELVGEYVNKWGKETIGERGYQNVGAVVGATFPEQAKKLRRICKKAIFLSPGYGAQGAKGADILPLFNDDGYGALISSSRAIIFSYDKSEEFSEKEYSKASRFASIKMKNDVIEALEDGNISPW